MSVSCIVDFSRVDGMGKWGGGTSCSVCVCVFFCKNMFDIVILKRFDLDSGSFGVGLGGGSKNPIFWECFFHFCWVGGPLGRK